MDINFDCPECGQNLDAPADMVGSIIECPICSKEIRIPSAHEGGHLHAEPQSAPEKPATPPARPSPTEEAAKGVTTRIELPPDFAAPKRDRKMFIKRR